MQQNVPNQAIHVVEAPNEKANLKDACYTKAATVLGVLHIICGVISLGAESAFLDSKYSIGVGAGIWTAVFFFISGALSIGGAQSGNKCLVVATMVMSIISAVLAVNLIGLSSTWLAHINAYRYTSYNNGYLTYAYYVAEHNQAESSLGLLIAMGVIMLGISIASASLTCKLLCCRSNNQGAVHYNPNQGAYNPNQGPYNPNQEPSNVLVNPNYNPNQIAPVNPPNV